MSFGFGFGFSYGKTLFDKSTVSALREIRTDWGRLIVDVKNLGILGFIQNIIMINLNFDLWDILINY